MPDETTNPVQPTTDPLAHAGGVDANTMTDTEAGVEQPRVVNVREHEVIAELRRALGDEQNTRRAVEHENERLTRLLRIAEEKVKDAKLAADATINGASINEGDLRALAFGFVALSEHSLMLEALVTRFSGETTIARNMLNDAIRNTAKALSTDPITPNYNFTGAVNARYQLQHAVKNAQSLNGILKNVLDLAKLFVPIPIKL